MSGPPSASPLAATLDFFSESDRLVGAYFQAMQQQTFDVEFVRQK